MNTGSVPIHPLGVGDRYGRLVADDLDVHGGPFTPEPIGLGGNGGIGIGQGIVGHAIRERVASRAVGAHPWQYPVATEHPADGSPRTGRVPLEVAGVRVAVGVAVVLEHVDHVRGRGPFALSAVVFGQGG